MNDDELSELLNSPISASNAQSDRRMQSVLHKTRVSVGQQQTLALVLIQIWVAAMKLLAPFFAMTVKKHVTLSSNNSHDFKNKREPD